MSHPNAPPPEAEPPSGTGKEALASLVSLLDLAPTGPDLYAGTSPKDRWQRVFGGQVLGQALVAASRSVTGRQCHSLHAYFLRAGDPRTPIAYEVDRSRDGASFSARRVVARQDGQAIFTMSASFAVEESGLEHQSRMPDVPAPETLPGEEAWRREALAYVPEQARARLLRPRPIELRLVEPANRFVAEKRAARQIVWFRAAGPLPGDAALHQCVLAYASDMTLLDTSLLPHGFTLFSANLQLASLDHAMWFHRSFRADEWLLYVQDSPSASGSRSFNRGEIFRRDGTHIASVVQEGLVRLRNGGS